MWDDPEVDWSSAGITVIRSTWDYHLRRERFLGWTRSVARLWNPAPTVAWNTDKRYLLDLREALPVVPTHVLADTSPDTIERALATLELTDAVLKPAVGLDGHGVKRIRAGAFDFEPRPGVWLLQPFLAEAASLGETSVVVIDGRPTHAVARRPPPDDFRAQQRLGGRVEPVELDDDVHDLAVAAVADIDPIPLYARVDIVRDGTDLALMELELVEPSLFLEHGADVLEAVTAAIRRRLPE